MKRKQLSKNAQPQWPSNQLVEQLREKLHNRIETEELESAWRLEALDRLIGILQLEPTTFQRLWIEPLLEAGATMDAAIAGIVASYFLPN
jgi:hypothetical protein